MTIIEGAQQQAGSQPGTRAALHTSWDTTARQRKQTGVGTGFTNLKACLQWCTSSNKDTPLNSFQTVSPTGDQIFKYRWQWGPFSLRPQKASCWCSKNGSKLLRKWFQTHKKAVPWKWKLFLNDVMIATTKTQQDYCFHLGSAHERHRCRGVPDSEAAKKCSVTVSIQTE